MKIKKIRFENFRQFKEPGTITCSTDGRVTIVYGKIGSGKTTLHQLCQWVLYGKVSFNKTADADALYNFEYASEQYVNKEFEVKGALEFEHLGVDYELIRTAIFRKTRNEEPSSKKIKETVFLQEKNQDNDWKPSEKTMKEMIELFVPEALSNYFFFDGETMISDLRMKSNQSAKALKRALHSILDLELWQNAEEHIGDVGKKRSIIGMLNKELEDTSNDAQLKKLGTTITLADKAISTLKNQIDEKTETKTKNETRIQEISQQIGGITTKAEYNRRRAQLVKDRDKAINNLDKDKRDFGAAIKRNYPEFLVSRVGVEAQNLFELEIAKKEIPYGLTKKLVKTLLKKDSQTCVCGRALCEAEKKHIEEFLEAFPPKDYATLYSEFLQESKLLQRRMESNAIEQVIMDYLQNLDSIEDFKKRIKALDDEEKQSPDIEELVTERANLEDANVKLEKEIRTALQKVGEETKLNDARKATYKKQQEKLGKNKNVLKKIEIMESVRERIKQTIKDKSSGYSKSLENNITYLIDNMLVETVRKVTVDQDFSMKVFDNYNSQAKSEGQFAVVSFAYIGGILKMLRSEEHLKSKEYPLVLDGPFSKLDSDQRQNVVNMLPTFAPQVILFSKDDLHGVFAEENIGRVWTIVSNDEKNLARVEEGHLWS